MLVRSGAHYRYGQARRHRLTHREQGALALAKNSEENKTLGFSGRRPVMPEATLATSPATSSVSVAGFLVWLPVPTFR